MWANRALLQTNWPEATARATGADLTAGLLMFRRCEGTVQFFIMHQGGPYLVDHDLGTWTIPRGEVHEGESLLNAARQRFAEEIGLPAFGPFIPLRTAVNRHGIVMHGWAFETPSDVDADSLSGTETGTRTGWFTASEARLRIDPAQAPWIEEVLTTG